ncbi:4Fe-4S binding protein [Desulforhopalus sp. 52FAK]
MTNGFYYQTNGVIPDLGAGFDVSEDINEQKYIISNSNESKTEMYAPEINFYYANSLDQENLKADKLKILYQARFHRYDYAQDVVSSLRVGTRVAIISDDPVTDLTARLEDQGYVVVEVSYSAVSEIHGTLGNFSIVVNSDGERTELSSDHVVWAGDSAYDRKIVGMCDFKVLGLEGTLEQITANSGLYKYKNGVTYNLSACLQKNRRKEVCGKCVDVCPNSAITMDQNGCSIELSHIQCVACGSCVSICPTGALDYASITRDAFTAIDKLYKDSIALVIGEDTLINDRMSCILPEKILPLVVDSVGFIDEDHLISLIQSSGYPVILWQDVLSEHQQDCVNLVNDIFVKIYNRQVVYHCSLVSEIVGVAELCEKLDLEEQSVPDSDLGKRVRISERLAALVGDDDFGLLTPKSTTPYGTIKINTNNCTLCLSCVDACIAHALIPHAEDNSLRFTASSCVQCGYCETICPENDCLEVIYNQLDLSGGFFTSHIMAQDTLFKCIECGEGFAPVQSIEKIIALMTPSFGDDSLRIKSLSCCPDCKAKVMLEAITADI